MSGGEVAQLQGAGERSGDPLTRADRIMVTMLAALLGGTIVGFVAIGGQLVGLQRQIGDLRAEMHREIGEVADRITRVETRLTGVETRLTGVETRLTGVETRLTRVETQIETRLVPASDSGDPAGP